MISADPPIDLQKTIEDLSAKNSALISEVANLKLELAIVSTLAKAKDSTMSRMRRSKVILLSFSGQRLSGLARARPTQVLKDKLQASSRVLPQGLYKLCAC